MSVYYPKRYSFRHVRGISSNQLEQHYQLYVGYVNKWNEIQKILEQTPEFPNANATFSLLRGLQKGQSYALNGIKLHELYFANLGAGHPYDPDRFRDLAHLLRRDFAGYEVFSRRFMEVAQAVRGWVVLAMDPIDQRLHIYGSDAHDEGSLWLAWPLLVLDVYEHAYMIDFGIKRQEYVKVFMQNIDWAVVHHRLRNFHRLRESTIDWP